MTVTQKVQTVVRVPRFAFIRYVRRSDREVMVMKEKGSYAHGSLETGSTAYRAGSIRRHRRGVGGNMGKRGRGSRLI